MSSSAGSFPSKGTTPKARDRWSICGLGKRLSFRAPASQAAAGKAIKPQIKPIMLLTGNSGSEQYNAQWGSGCIYLYRIIVNGYFHYRDIGGPRIISIWVYEKQQCCLRWH